MCTLTTFFAPCCAEKCCLMLLVPIVLPLCIQEQCYIIITYLAAKKPFLMIMFCFRNETSLVNLELMTNEDEKVQQVIYGRDYKLRAHFSKPDGEIKIMLYNEYRVGKKQADCNFRFYFWILLYFVTRLSLL